MKKRRNIIVLVLALIIVFSGCQKENKETLEIPEVVGSFDFTVLKAGQADAIFLQTENHSIILDCGEKDDGDELVELLQEKGISNVDYIFITHFDKDHVGGFPEVMDNVTASNIIVPDYEGNNDEYEEYLKTVSNKGLQITPLTKDTNFILDDVLFEISVPKKQSYAEGDNDFSLVISVTHGDNTFLFAGDAEADRLTEVIATFGRQYDFLKVPHHGKLNKNTKRFIKTIKPTYSVICDSEKNPAEDETVSILEFVESEIYSTRNGNVSVLSDGKEIKIMQ
ncbi:MAG: MBL fold metallo-hydrolase [Clostridia bacterium]|nr:MBL fold metallo-hydrolase [Clostridia bacterium]